MTIVGAVGFVRNVRLRAMFLDTARFGRLQCQARDILLFPAGLIGFEQLHTWLWLDEQPLVWLQSVEDSQVALPLVSPFRYVPEYRLELAATDCRELDLATPDQAAVFVVVARDQSQWTLNLRAPVIIRPDVRLGRQVVVSIDQPLRHALPRAVGTLRKSA